MARISHKYIHLKTLKTISEASIKRMTCLNFSSYIKIYCEQFIHVPGIYKRHIFRQLYLPEKYSGNKLLYQLEMQHKFTKTTQKVPAQ